MGLCISARSSDYKYIYNYNEETQEDEETEIGEDYYCDADIGYIGFKNFRDKLVEFATNGKFTDIANDKYDDGEPLCWAFYDDETYQIGIDKNIFTEEDLKKESIKKYLNKLNHMKENYPKLYQIFPFIAHSDCEGEVPYEQVLSAYPIIKEFYEVDKTNYGYWGKEYNFTECLLKTFETVIEKKGKLYFC